MQPSLGDIGGVSLTGAMPRDIVTACDVDWDKGGRYKCGRECISSLLPGLGGAALRGLRFAEWRTASADFAGRCGPRAEHQIAFADFDGRCADPRSF